MAAWTVKIQEIDTVCRTVTQAVGIETENGKDVGIFGGIGSKYDRPSGSGKENYYVENLIEEIDRPENGVSTSLPIKSISCPPNLSMKGY